MTFTGLAYQQISEVLTEHDNLTLHNDGTSKFGHHYGSFQVSTEGNAYSLGLSDMLTGSAQQTLDALKQILSDLEFVVGKGVQTSLLSKIKNTLSDRHIVEKKFKNLLEDFRLEILPDVINAWNDLSEEKQQQIAFLNNLECTYWFEYRTQLHEYCCNGKRFVWRLEQLHILLYKSLNLVRLDLYALH